VKKLRGGCRVLTGNRCPGNRRMGALSLGTGPGQKPHSQQEQMISGVDARSVDLLAKVFISLSQPTGIQGRRWITREIFFSVV
jgi:hypothetical protein